MAEQRPAAEAEVLFLTRRRQPFTRRGLQERVKHYTVQAGLAETAISCHRLRHTFARRMAEARMPLPSLSHWLGHNHLSTTQVYIDGANPQLRADYQRAMAMLAENQAERADLGETAQSALVPLIPACVAQAPILEADEIRPKRQTFPTWLSQEVVLFLAAKQARWQPHYRRERAQQWLGELSRAWSWLPGQRAMATLADLHRADLADYVAHLHGQGLSSYTINHFLTTFWAFLKFAEERGALVAPGLYRLPRPQKPEWSPRPLSEAAYQRLQQALAQATAAMTPAEAARHRCWFCILADGGLRIGELRTLTVADWHAASRTLTIRYGKGRHQRQVLLTARAAQAIADHLATRQLTPPAPSEPLVAHLGQAVSPPFIRHHLHAFAQQAQLEGVTPHRLRHTYATRLLNTGQMPVTTLQKLMGHHDIDTTMRYVQLYDTTIRRDFEAAMAVLQAQPSEGLDDTLWVPTIDAIFKVQEEVQAPVSTPPAPFANCM
ncbi:MAG TPA: site-specific integrase [Anaerolineae bacterium]